MKYDNAIAANAGQKSVRKPEEPAKMDQDLPAIPCGLVAKSFFNDTYTLRKCLNNDPNCEEGSTTESTGN